MLVQRYYRLWDERKYADMYGLLSSRYRRLHPYTSWLPEHTSTQTISVTTVHAESSSVVALTLRSQDFGESHSDNYVGTWQVVRENGSFRLDTANLRLGESVQSAAATSVNAPAGYVYTHTAESLTYGQPAELSTIRGRLTAICTGGRHYPGLGPAYANELIQVGDYAIAEGSCGNPELHVALRKVHGLWQEASHGAQRCGFGGGVVPDYGQFGLYRMLVSYCGFPSSVVRSIIVIRSRQAYIATADRNVLALEAACAKNPQVDFSCPGHRFTAAQQRNIDYNRYFSETTAAVSRGDFAGALSTAQRALAIEPAGFHDQELRIAELHRLISAIASGTMTKAQAIAEWRRLGL